MRTVATTEIGSASTPIMMSHPGIGRAPFLSETVRSRLMATATNPSVCMAVPIRKMFKPRITESWAAMTRMTTAKVHRNETRVAFLSLARSVPLRRGMMCRLEPTSSIPTPPYSAAKLDA